MSIQTKYLKLNDIVAYKKSYLLSNKIWNLVLKWDYLAKDTVGKQFVRSIDSISANIAEGFGRYHKKDKQKFYFNARGSIYESLDWLQKANDRELINKNDYQNIMKILKELPREINGLISYTENRLKK